MSQQEHKAGAPARHLLKPASGRMWQVFAFRSCLIAAAARPPSSEGSLFWPVDPLLGGLRRSFATVPLADVIGIVRALVGAASCLTICLTVAPVAHGQSPENVAVVVNDNSADSQRIAEHYARTRGLPQSNVLRIQTSSDEAIERDAYVRTIEQPLGLAIKRAGLQDRLLYLVLTKGVPLRILGTTGVSGTLASVDSELTLLYRRLVGQPISPQGKIDNPYYQGIREIGEARPFSHREHDIYLVTRIDAFTVDQAVALIDRAQAPARDGRASEERA